MSHLEYYDPARQEDPTEHYECSLEDGEIWFGHGMICRYPELHPEFKELNG